MLSLRRDRSRATGLGGPALLVALGLLISGLLLTGAAPSTAGEDGRPLIVRTLIRADANPSSYYFELRVRRARTAVVKLSPVTQAGTPSADDSETLQLDQIGDSNNWAATTARDRETSCYRTVWVARNRRGKDRREAKYCVFTKASQSTVRWSAEAAR